MTLIELLKNPQDELDRLAGRAITLSLRAALVMESVNSKGALSARLMADSVVTMISNQGKNYDFLRRPEPVDCSGGSFFERSSSMSGPHLSATDLAATCSRMLDAVAANLDRLKGEAEAIDGLFCKQMASGGTSFRSAAEFMDLQGSNFDRYLFVVDDSFEEKSFERDWFALQQRLAQSGFIVADYPGCESTDQVGVASIQSAAELPSVLTRILSGRN